MNTYGDMFYCGENSTTQTVVLMFVCPECGLWAEQLLPNEGFAQESEMPARGIDEIPEGRIRLAVGTLTPAALTKSL